MQDNVKSTYKTLPFKHLLFFLFVSVVIRPNDTCAQDRREIIVNVKITDSDKDKQLIIFNPSRPLKIEDFKGQPKYNSKAVATILSGVKMGISSLTEKDRTVVDIDLTCYFDPRQSWMKPKGRNPKVLDHEQRHFEITAIQTCKLFNAIKNTTFTDNWHKELIALKEKYIEELEKMQENYDRETRHGTLRGKQLAYNQRIDEDLKKENCF